MKRILTIAALIALSACSSIQPTPSTPQQAVYEVKGDYAAALTLAVQYRDLPPCVASGPLVCSDDGVVIQLQTADSVAAVAIDAAEKTVRDPALDAGTVSAAVTTARNAVDAFAGIANALKLK